MSAARDLPQTCPDYWQTHVPNKQMDRRIPPNLLSASFTVDKYWPYLSLVSFMHSISKECSEVRWTGRHDCSVYWEGPVIHSDCCITQLPGSTQLIKDIACLKANYLMIWLFHDLHIVATDQLAFRSEMFKEILFSWCSVMAFACLEKSAVEEYWPIRIHIVAAHPKR